MQSPAPWADALSIGPQGQMCIGQGQGFIACSPWCPQFSAGGDRQGKACPTAPPPSLQKLLRSSCSAKTAYEQLLCKNWERGGGGAVLGSHKILHHWAADRCKRGSLELAALRGPGSCHARSARSRVRKALGSNPRVPTFFVAAAPVAARPQAFLTGAWVPRPICLS